MYIDFNQPIFCLMLSYSKINFFFFYFVYIKIKVWDFFIPDFYHPFYVALRCLSYYFAILTVFSFSRTVLTYAFSDSSPEAVPLCLPAALKSLFSVTLDSGCSASL